VKGQRHRRTGGGGRKRESGKSAQGLGGDQNVGKRIGGGYASGEQTHTGKKYRTSTLRRGKRESSVEVQGRQKVEGEGVKKGKV